MIEPVGNISSSDGATRKSRGAGDRAYFSLKTQFENVGDALINRELVRLVSGRVPSVVDVSRCPPAFVATLGLADNERTTLIYSTFGLFCRILMQRLSGRVAYYFLSPGGYVGEKHGKDLLSSWANTAILFLLYLAGVRICHVALSYERLGPRHLKVLQWRSKLLHAHYVRDEDSLSYAHSVGLNVGGVMPDLAFGAAPDAKVATGDRTAIALSFRTDQSPEQRQRVYAWVQALDRALPAELSFRFVSQVERDHASMIELSSMLGGRDVRYEQANADIDRCLAIYAGCSHVLSNRLHSLLLGALAGSRPIAVVEHDLNAKIVGLFSSLDRDQNVLDLRDASSPANATRLISGGVVAPIDVDVQAARLGSFFDRLLSVSTKAGRM